MMSDDFGTFNSVPPDYPSRKSKIGYEVLSDELLVENFEINIQSCELSLKQSSYSIKAEKFLPKSWFNGPIFFIQSLEADLHCAKKILKSIKIRKALPEKTIQKYQEKIQNFRVQALNLKKTIDGR